jgi:hypothetical protein
VEAVVELEPVSRGVTVGTVLALPGTVKVADDVLDAVPLAIVLADTVNDDEPVLEGVVRGEND